MLLHTPRQVEDTMQCYVHTCSINPWLSLLWVITEHFLSVEMECSILRPCLVLAIRISRSHNLKDRLPPPGYLPCFSSRSLVASCTGRAFQTDASQRDALSLSYASPDRRKYFQVRQTPSNCSLRLPSDTIASGIPGVSNMVRSGVRRRFTDFLEGYLPSGDTSMRGCRLVVCLLLLCWLRGLFGYRRSLEKAPNICRHSLFTLIVWARAVSYAAAWVMERGMGMYSSIRMSLFASSQMSLPMMIHSFAVAASIPSAVAPN